MAAPITEAENNFINSSNKVPFWRHLAALMYDSLIVLALWMLATVLVLPLNSGEAVDSGNWMFQLYLVVIAVGFYVCFWRFGGQTLGMRAWRIKLLNNNPEARPSWVQLIIRALSAVVGAACLGAGYIWAFFDRDHRYLHDRLSKTQLHFTSTN